MKITKIVILFDDNGFYTTFTGVLGVIKHAINNGLKGLTKKRLVKLINELSLGIYLADQSQFEYFSTKKNVELLREYLKIQEKDILINKEAAKYIEEGVWNNGIPFVLDMTTNTIR